MTFQEYIENNTINEGKPTNTEELIKELQDILNMNSIEDIKTHIQHVLNYLERNNNDI